MTSSDSPKDHAQALLRTLCNFILPLIQTSVGQTTVDTTQIILGIEADALVIELEKFISSIISRSQPRSQEVAIEATLLELNNDPLNFFEEANWLWDIPEDIPDNITDLNEDDKKLESALQSIRRYVTQNMPIRLLCFEPQDSNLKISLFEKTDIYNYLAKKYRADVAETGEYVDFDIWRVYRTGYAILSHTWTPTPGELTYGEWQSGLFDARHPKCQKLIKFCNAALKKHGLTLGWIDTVCINKESSAELDESIRSMYTWYHNAEVCIAYLAGTNTISNMHNDPWFTRGWTFQELIAPESIKFYDMDWNQLSSISSSDDKEDHLILKEISNATTITRHELRNIGEAPISRRMQLAAKRQVTREEDMAYCLMGIFNVSISTAYGEGGNRAFFRLVEEIFRSTENNSDIFNWAGERNPLSERITSLFPSEISNYLNRSANEKLNPWRPIEPLTLTYLGLRTPILLMPAILHRESISGTKPIGNYHATLSITASTGLQGMGNIPQLYHLLDERAFEPEYLYEEYFTKRMMALRVGTLNVEEHETSIHIPRTCLAVLLKRSWDEDVDSSTLGFQKIYTEDPVVFDLESGDHTNVDSNRYIRHYQIERSQLANHGMQLVTLYL